MVTNTAVIKNSEVVNSASFESQGATSLVVICQQVQQSTFWNHFYFEDNNLFTSRGTGSYTQSL